MKQWLNGVGDWLNYVRNYKTNKETDTIIDHRLIDYENKVAKLKDEIEMRKCIIKEHEKLINKLDERIRNRNEKISTLTKENKSLHDENLIITRDNEKLKEKIDLTEKRRRANATTIGAKNRKIRNLEKEMVELIENHKYEIAKLKHRINFLENSKHSPTKEEILAYEMSMKEVERRIKEK